MKTKGALVWELNEPWSIDEIEIGDPRRGEVTVQLETAGLCHSDHHLMTGDFPIPSYPGAGWSRGRRDHHRGRRGRREPGRRRSRGDVIHPVLRDMPAVPDRTAQPVRPGHGPAVGPIGVRRVVSGHRAGPQRHSDVTAGHLCAVRGRAPDLGGQDRPHHPLRRRLPGGLRGDDRLRLGGAQRGGYAG